MSAPDEYCILLAEDDEIVRYLAARALSQRGFCVLQARDGEEALRLEAEYDGTIHVLVTNVRMPNLNGHDLAREIKRKRPDVKILIVSAEAEDDFPREAYHHDFALMKPVTSPELIENVERLLRQRGDTPARTDVRH
jgi:two-component system cell cycle sensor histidine kinase/response regulator CckA